MKPKSDSKSATDVTLEVPALVHKDGNSKPGKTRPRPLTFGRIIQSMSLSKGSCSKAEKSEVSSPRTAITVRGNDVLTICETEAEENSAFFGEATALSTPELLIGEQSSSNFLSITGCKGSRSGCNVREDVDNSPTNSPIASRPNRHTVGTFDQVIREHGGFDFSSVAPSPLSPLSNSASRDMSAYAVSSTDDLLATFDLTGDDLCDASMQDYTVGRTLGRGRYGKVKQATHNLSGVPVALKVIAKKALSENKEIANEVHALRELKHKYVMRMYDVIDAPNALVLVLELLDGGELFDYIVVRTKLSEKEARKFLRQILLGLRYCHARGIVHRDLKLENMLLDSNGDVKIGDFGFSNIFRADSLMSTFVGSAAYAAPEILANEQYVGPATDVWSLGVIMYTLLVGKQPFDHSGNQATFFQKVQAAEFEIPGFISKEAQEMITSILRRNPQERPTVAELCKHPWITAGNDFVDADIPDNDLGDQDDDSQVDPSILEQLAGAGIPTETVETDLVAGNLTRATAAYKLCKIGRVRDAINREQDAEINAIANMLAATRTSAGNSPLMARKRVPAKMKGHSRVASEFGMERRIMSTESNKTLKRSPKASKKESFINALSLASGTGNDDEPSVSASPKSSKSVPKLKPVRMRATTVSAAMASAEALMLDHPGYEHGVDEDKPTKKSIGTVFQAPTSPSSSSPTPTKSARAVAKKTSENELSRAKAIGSPLASRRETSASLTQDAQPSQWVLNTTKSKDSILSARSRTFDSNGAIDFHMKEAGGDTKPDVRRTSSLDPSVDGLDINIEPASPTTPTAPASPLPQTRRLYARYASDRGGAAGVADSVLSLQPGPSSPMSRIQTGDESRADFSSMPFLHSNGAEQVNGDAGMAYSAVTLIGEGMSASSPIRRKKSKMAHLRDMLAWGHGRDSLSSVSSSSSMESPATTRSRGHRKGSSDLEDEAAVPVMTRGQSKHTVLSTATTSNKPRHKIVEEMIRVCKANKVKCVHEGNILMCIWKPGKRELRHIQDEMVILDNDITIRWEMEVHKIEKLDLHGIRLRRTGGDIWLYKTLCTRLMEQMKL